MVIDFYVSFKMTIEQNTYGIWFGFCFVIAIINLSILWFHSYNIRNQRSLLWSKLIFYIMQISSSIVHFFFLIITPILFDDLIGISICCLLLFLSYNIPHFISRSLVRSVTFYVFMMMCTICIFSLNFTLISFYYKQDDVKPAIFNETYYYILFSSSLGVNVTLFNSMFHLINNETTRPSIEIKFEKISEPPDDTCSICLEEFKIKSCVKTPCNHIYHENCIKVSIQNNKKCPLCRFDFV